MSFLKPVVIAVLVILTVLIIWKANKFATSGRPNQKAEPSGEKTQRPQPTPAAAPRVQKPSQQIEFFVVYVGRRVPVTHYPFTIGSRSDNDLIVSDSTVSRQHAEFLRKNGQVVLRDLGSLNGTFINKTPCSETVIHGGERVQIGTTVLQIERSVDEVSDETAFIRR